MKASEVKTQLQIIANPEKALLLQGFFKTGEGQYGEGDLFMGITVPQQRSIAKNYKELPLSEIGILLHEPYHECRLTALIILVNRFKKTKNEADRKEIVDFYLSNTAFINNWDLVDLSACYILGEYLLDKDRTLIYQLAQSESLWEQRIAVLTTFTFIRNDDFADNLLIAEMLLNHKHDLIHKAIGWMLREVGKRNKSVLVDFLMQYSLQMPRTMLRYAIEKFPEEERLYFLKRI